MDLNTSLPFEEALAPCSIIAHERRESAHRGHPTSNKAGYAFNLSETATANTENGRDRERPEHQRAGGLFVARNTLPVAWYTVIAQHANKSRERNGER